MENLIKVTHTSDVLPEFRGTPVEELLEYNNIGREYRVYQKARILVGMCMDNRKHLHIPDN